MSRLLMVMVLFLLGVFPTHAHTVRMNAPTNGAILTAPATVYVEAQAIPIDDGERISSHILYQNGAQIASGGQVVSATVSGLGPGTYQFRSTAVNNKGVSKQTTPVSITVVPAANQAPAVSMGTPGGAPFIAPAPVWLTASASDPDGAIARVDFYRDGTGIGSDSTPPYEISYTAPGAGTYTFWAVAIDNVGAQTTSGSVAVGVAANAPPSVGIAAPTTGATYLTPTVIPIVANAGDGDGWITQVNFYANGQFLGSDTSAPFEMSWSTGQLAGTRSIQVTAIDNKGGSTSAYSNVVLNSPAGNISVNPYPCTIPSGDSCVVTLNWTSNDPNAQVRRLFSHWVLTQEGIWEYQDEDRVVATGATGSMPVTVQTDHANERFQLRVNGAEFATAYPKINYPPWVTITVPTKGQLFISPGVIAISATANDSDGTVSKMEFYANGSLIATDTSAPYDFVWSNVPSGEYTISAVAYDNWGAIRTPAPASSIVNVIVNDRPTVALTGPANGEVVTSPSPIIITADAADTDGSVSKVEFYADGALVGTDTVAPYSVSWSPAQTKVYTLSAIAQDNRGTATTSASRSVTYNAPPLATLVAPGAGQVFHAPASIAFNATATDADGTVTKVEFYANGRLLATDTAAPYEHVWSNVPAGAYTISAVAYDNWGAIRTPAPASSMAAITVNARPAVALTAPADGTVVTSATPVTLSADAADADGVVTRVEFYVDGALVGADTAAPFSATWTPAAPKAYALTAVAYDNAGGTATSAARTFTFNGPPTVAISSPRSGKIFTVSTPITLAADANDPGGAVTKVEFFAGTTLIGTATSAPYSVTWNGASTGRHQVTAKATDNDGAATISETIAINMMPAGTLTRTYVYDANQQLCKLVEPETGATVYAYDNAGNLSWSAAGLDLPSDTNCDTAAAYDSGRRVNRGYSTRNRLSALTFPDGNGNQAWTYTLDGLPSNVTTYNDGGTTAVVNGYAYNKRRLLTQESAQQTGYSWAMGYGYDENGVVASVAHPGGEVITFAPNALGQTRQAVSQFGTYASGAFYYPNGALKQFTYGNGIVHTLVQNTRGLPDRSLDAYGGVAVLDDSYDYDANGNVAAISDGLPGNRGNRDMTYDGLDRLRTASSPMFGTDPLMEYSYDGLDNLKRVKGAGKDLTYVYDGANRLTNVVNTVGGATIVGLGYDVQGNLANKNGQSYVFDYGNRLRYSNAQESYRYDANGRRVSAFSPTPDRIEIRSFYDASGVLRYQHDFRRNKVFNYVYLAGSLVGQRETPMGTSENVFKFHHTDALGSPVATTAINRVVLERSEYSPYGALLNRPIADGPGYTGHVMDAATGLTYMQQRYYDPGIGRFLSVDPVSASAESGANFNRYWYANNNPYKFIDPDGRLGCTGTKIQSNCEAGGTYDMGVTEKEVRDAKKNPQKYIERLNSRENSQGTVRGSARYFARAAMPLTMATGSEVGADIAQRLSGSKPYTVVNFVLGDAPAGDGSGAVGVLGSYSGPGVRVATIHTHPVNSPISGIAGRYSNGQWSSEFSGAYDLDTTSALRTGLPVFVATPDGMVSGFDYPAMRSAVDANRSGTFYAQDFVTTSP